MILIKYNIYTAQYYNNNYYYDRSKRTLQNKI